MATTSRQPGSRKRKRDKDNAAAAMPLRRSRRIAHRTIFRFNDLAPELRNTIYGMVLQRENTNKLTGKLPVTAKALSQVFHSVRAESLSTCYSVNRFHASLNYYKSPQEAQQEISRIEEWFASFGKLAATHVRVLRIHYMHLLLSVLYYLPRAQIAPRTRAHPHWAKSYKQYHELFQAQVARHSNYRHLARDLDLPQPLAFPLGGIRSVGRLRLGTEELQQLLTGLEMVFPHGGQPRSPGSLTTVAALLSQLDFEAE